MESELFAIQITFSRTSQIEEDNENNKTWLQKIYTRMGTPGKSIPSATIIQTKPTTQSPRTRYKKRSTRRPNTRLHLKFSIQDTASCFPNKMLPAAFSSIIYVGIAVKNLGILRKIDALPTSALRIKITARIDGTGREILQSPTVKPSKH